jgi:hypothetical protein
VVEHVAKAGASFVEWGSVLAGAVLVAANAFVMLTLGTAIGLSATSPWPDLATDNPKMRSARVMLCRRHRLKGISARTC